MNWLKIIKILTSLLVMAGIGWGIYYFFYQTPAGSNIIETIFGDNAAEEGSLINTGKVRALTDESISDYWLDSKTGAIYYLNETGEIIKISGENKTVISSIPVSKINSIQASPNGEFMLAKFNYPQSTAFSIFNTASETWQPLPAATIAAAWSPNSQNLAYVDDKSLKILNIRTKKTTEIMRLTQKDLRLHWLAESQILLSTFSGADEKIWAIDINKKTLALFLEGNNLAINWSDKNDLGIRLQIINSLPILGLIDNNGITLSDFSFLTMPEKCSFDGKKIYCAIPKNIPEGTKLPNDYHKKSVYFDDLIYLIDLSTGGFSEISTGLQNPIDVEHLKIVNNQLLFKNRLDGKLYSISSPEPEIQ